MWTILALIAWTAVAVVWNLRAQDPPPLRLIERGPRVRASSEISGKPGSDL
jgi:hypothetical protein